MEYIDYYKVLDVNKNASNKEIKKAYKKLARQYHPDLNPNNENAKKKFQEINEAHEVLSDPEKKKKYDKYGKDWEHAEAFEQARQQRSQSGSGGFGGYQSFGEEDFSDFFESMFGGRAHSRRTGFKGQDYRAEMRLPLSTLYKTHKRTLTIDGKNIRITIPAGVENGQNIRIKGYGSPGINEGPAGDLYIRFIIDNDTGFRREGSTLYKTINIGLDTAVMGGSVMVNTMNGNVKVNIKAGTQPGAILRLKGKGFPKYKKPNEYGDLLITVNVDIPNNLNSSQKELFSAFFKSLS